MTSLQPQTPLQSAVANAYRAFAHYRKPFRPLDVCLACCVPEEIHKQLCEWPLARLMARHFYEYNCSAKSQVQHPREVGYFVPRMLELLAEGEDLHHSLEIALDRLGRCPPGSWSPDEEAALSRYAQAYFGLVLCGGSKCGEDPLTVLLMFDIGGVAIEPLLDQWLQCEHPWSTVQFVRATYWDFWEHCEYKNAFADDRPDFLRKVRDWLLAPQHRQHFANKMLFPDFLALAQEQQLVGRTCFSTMVEGVFEQLTQQR